MKKEQKRYYFDYAATTPVDKRVLKAMKPYFSDNFANPSSIHTPGMDASEAVESSRKIIANYLGATPSEIFFTSSATESNNWALKGIAATAKGDKKKIIISPIEHHCVLNTAKYLKKMGFEIVETPVDKEGIVDVEKLKELVDDKTLLVSIMHSNNEMGTIEPIKEIGKICDDKNVTFHTDAVQSYGKMPLNVNEMNVDLLTASSHKIYGPKGTAILYIRGGTQIEALLHGGGQESDKRSSTLNVPGIVGFRKATEICVKEMKKEWKKQSKLRDKITKYIKEKIPNSHLNGPALGKPRLCNNVNVRFDFIEGESLLMDLDSHGIAVSTSSACSSPKLEASHVLTALGISKGDAHGTIRITIGRFTSEKDVKYFLTTLEKSVTKLRVMSPLNTRNC
ncbi:cysteine desulfurase [Patescibacteria group bacterium]|nr:cysteine desulfurase [Patescibacteria group bacterium]MBU1952855.1 cysteine desulfurase [Patescibacteria group bacterium]